MFVKPSPCENTRPDKIVAVVINDGEFFRQNFGRQDANIQFLLTSSEKGVKTQKIVENRESSLSYFIFFEEISCKQFLKLKSRVSVKLEAILYAGPRRPVKEIYPAPELIRLLKDYGVPVVLGSDAHAPDEVGKDFTLARKIAKECGHKEVVIFEQRKIVGTYPL